MSLLRTPDFILRNRVTSLLEHKDKNNLSETNRRSKKLVERYRARQRAKKITGVPKHVLGDKMTQFLTKKDNSSLSNTGRSLNRTVKIHRALQKDKTLILDNPTDEKLMRLAQLYPGTTGVSVVRAHQLTDKSLTFLAEHCPGLQTIELHADRVPPHALLAYFDNPRRNAELQISDLTLFALAQYCPQLLKLSVTGNCLFTDEGLMALGANAENTQWQHGCPMLQELFFGSPHATLLGLKAVLEGCLNLNIFVDISSTIKIPAAVLVPAHSNPISRRIASRMYNRGYGNGCRGGGEANAVRAWLRTQYPNVGAGFLTAAQRSEFNMRGTRSTMHF